MILLWSFGNKGKFIVGKGSKFIIGGILLFIGANVVNEGNWGNLRILFEWILLEWILLEWILLEWILFEWGNKRVFYGRETKNYPRALARGNFLFRDHTRDD